MAGWGHPFVVVGLGGRHVTTDELGALLARADADADVPFVDTVTVLTGRHLVLPPVGEISRQAAARSAGSSWSVMSRSKRTGSPAT